MLRLTEYAADMRAGSRVVSEPVLPPGPGQVLVRQYFAGINGVFDDVVARGEVPYIRDMPPFDLGVEAVGVVEEVGEGVDSLVVGDAVASSRLGGGYRLWLVDEAEGFLKIPSAEARYVALRTSAVSALLALEKAGGMSSGEAVVITAAAGGMGQFLVQFARMAGNTVVGICGSPQKAAALHRMGCHRPVDRSAQDVGAVLDDEFSAGIDLAVDTVGGGLFDVIVARLAKGGRLVSAGHAADYSPGGAALVLAPRIYEHLYWKGASVIGFQNSHYTGEHASAFQRILDWDGAGELVVEVDPVPFVGLESVHAAGDHLRSAQNVGKVVVDLR